MTFTPRAPRVTVLLPCYNAEQFLRATLDSLVSQTFADLEILAIDDGSLDRTSEILTGYAARDSRIRLMPNDRNCGLIHTLNRGMALARGPLVARIDADDVAVPERIARQVAFFDSRPGTDMLFTDVSYIGVNGQLLSNPASNDISSRTLRFLMFFFNPLCHPTLMGRREVFLEHPYAADAVHSEDFELWHRMIDAGVVIEKLPERLLRFRANPGSVSMRHEQQQSELFLDISAAAIERYFGFRISAEGHRVLTNRMQHGTVRAEALREALQTLRLMRDEYVVREALDRRDVARIDSFVGRHVVNVLFHGYKRSASLDPARPLAAREMLRLTLRNPLPTWRLAAQKGRERLSR